ncbi:MAG: chemotaxis protein CheW [Cyanobacteria bacterium J06597_1]
MPTQSYLTLGLFNSKYGIAANLVREIFPLPELRSIPEMPGDVIGVLDLRGTIIPVMHLAKRLGLPLQECSLSDSVVVVEWEEVLMGVIVHDTYEVIALDESDIGTEPQYGRSDRIHTAFVGGVATVNDELISLIAAEPLIREPDRVVDAVADLDSVSSEGSELDSGSELDPSLDTDTASELETSPESADGLGDFYSLYCPNIAPADRAMFQVRAENLRQPLDASLSDTRDRLPLAIVSLNDQYFGIELSAVKEFITVGHITNIPCCPRHIVGSTNLRGEILVLVDVRSALNLSPSSASDRDRGASEDEARKAIVIEVGDIVAGILVDTIYDVDYVPSTDIASVPSNVSDTVLDYLNGTLLFDRGMLSILNMPKLIGSGRFVVDEVV